MQIGVDQIDDSANAAAAGSDDEICKKGRLEFPLLSYSGWPLSVRLMMTGAVEYLAAELLELSGNCAKDVNCIVKSDVALAVERDEELAAVARSWGIMDTITTDTDTDTAEIDATQHSTVK